MVLLALTIEHFQKEYILVNKRTQEYYRGCIIGGAIGDALGSPVEFLKSEQINQEYGTAGITNLVCAESGFAEITDDTQMTLFTAEGILRAKTNSTKNASNQRNMAVYQAYQRWLVTQGDQKNDLFSAFYNGWLLEIEELYARRGPGNTCLTSLSSGKPGTIAEPINNSKGCGGVMRVAPVGLFYPAQNAFQIAADFAALTHGHPSGYLSAGTFALIIALIVNGCDIKTAVNYSLKELESYDRNQECMLKLKQALELSDSSVDDLRAIKQLGEGWVGEEALAVAVYCALKYDDIKTALIAAVNHGGDSDSTGAITGNILGAYWGLGCIPPGWLQKIELREVLLQMADDLLCGPQISSEWLERYPG